MRIILLVIPVCLFVLAEARRAQQIRPRVEQPQVYYVDEDDQGAEEEESPVVYQPRTRALPSPRSKDTNASKPPPVQTIRNYNKVNDDGSFTFGYEAADGSFKEETRGTDCVVRGKYGYVDPDGNKREFTYVSGNPCDPNAPKEDDDEPARAQQEEDVSGPANYPSVRPVPRPVRPTYTAPTTRAPTTVFQSQYEIADDDESQELADVRPRPAQPHRRPSVVTIPRRQQYNSQTPATPSQSSASVYQSAASRYPTQTTPSPAYRTSPASPSTIYRAFEASTTPSPRPQTYRPPFVPSVSITPRPHAAQVAAQYAPPSQTERPGVIFASASPSHLVNHRTTSTVSPSPVSASPSATSLDFAAELERYVNTVGISPRPVRPTRPSPPPQQAAKVKTSAPATDPIYQSELVYDPSTARTRPKTATTSSPTASARTGSASVGGFRLQTTNARKFRRPPAPRGNFQTAAVADLSTVPATLRPTATKTAATPSVSTSRIPARFSTLLLHLAVPVVE
ncbi:mucin-5AC-like isoform X2 [Athalia rosae]|uniref:mucin-5AC-like isoform X2 n=1 Tax=Athalia rosae TaxID=37344 RepID=UPI0020338C45|nr:mucin-5AC-like isoform X2 [Athalia rosae]